MKEENKQTAIVVGAGVGGIATAIQLAKQGYQVEVYEKNANPGGRCGQIVKDGHRFDLGATIFLMPSIYRQVFESLGLNFDECLDLKPLPEIYRLYFDDGEIFRFTSNQAEMEAQLERIEPGSTSRFYTFIESGYRMFESAIQELLGRNFFRLFDFINLRNVGLLFRIKTHITHVSYIRRFFTDPHLRAAFTFQNIYVGQDPNRAPALFSMLPAAEWKEGSFFAQGGMYSVVEKLVSTAEGLGVEFHYNSPVSRLNVKGKRVESITFEDGTSIQASLVVANADLPYVYKQLLPDQRKSACLDKRQYSCSALVFHWGLDKPYRQLGLHSVFFLEPFKEGLDKIFKDRSMGSRPSFYVYAPVGLDATAAPENQDTLSVIVPVGYQDPKKPQDWEALKLVARKAVLERLKREGLEDLEEHIKFELTCTPQHWNTSLNVAKGAIFGSISHHILQMGYFRPHSRHAKYRNLYFVGGSTHPGNGVPLVLLSSKLTAERILRDSTLH